MENKENVFQEEIKIEKDEFEKVLEEVLDERLKTFTMDGFRKGKVPKDVYLKKQGKESLYMDAVDHLLPVAYQKAIESKNYKPIIEPDVDLKSIDSNGCVFLFTITTKPSVTIKTYKNLNVKKDEVKVSKEEIDTEIKNMLEKYSELVVKEEGNVEEGNIAIIDFEGFKGDVAFEGGKGENYSLEIGSHTFIEGFEEQLIGMKKGEEKEIKVTFPKDYQSEELRGQDATFKVKVNEIKEKKQRTLDEEFFEDLAISNVKDEESLRKEVEESIKASKDMDAENKYVDEILKKIKDNTTVEVPEKLVDKEVSYMIERFNNQLRMQGIDLNIYYEITKSNEEALKESMKEEALNHLKYEFILDEIKTLENITVEDKEMQEELTKSALQYGMSDEEFLKAVGGEEAFKYELEVRKVIDFLKENN